jgi:acylphosphatase
VSDDQRQKREVDYRGTVQGVGFRYNTRRIAAAYSVTGYVRNLRDGRVHLVAEGLSAELDRFFDAVQAQLGHYIDDVTQSVGPASGQFDRFEIRL